MRLAPSFPSRSFPGRCLLLGLTLVTAASAAAAPPSYVDATPATGLDYTHFSGATGQYHFPEISGGGGALLDSDGDGDLDLFFVQSSILERGAEPAAALFPPAAGAALSDRLFRNDLERPGATPRFTDVTAEAGFAEEREHGQGVAVGDFDGDGRPDLYVTNAGPNRLWRNRGDGTFEDVTEAAGAGDGRWSVPATFFDADADGDLDLYVGNYVDYVPTRNIPCKGNSGRRDYCGPASYAAEPDRLLINQGDGTFRDASAEAGFTETFGPALGVVDGDFDGDGHADLYVANDGAANQLWMGRGDGTFGEEALLRGVALNAAGRAEASMGIAAGDPDEDGDEDLFVTHLRNETNTFYLNAGDGLFRDATAAAGLTAASVPRTGFGTAWTDHDLDGDLDLVVANGAVLAVEEQRQAEALFPFAEPGQLFDNLGSQEGPKESETPTDRPPRFREIAAEAAPALAAEVVGRALLVGDLDEDGDEDLVVVANSGPARVLLNTAIQGGGGGNGSANAAGRWIGLRPLLPQTTDGALPRDAVGAVVTVRPDNGEPRRRRVRTGGSYATGQDARVRVALPAVDDAKAEVTVDVLWPDRTRETWEGLAPGRYHPLLRGSGKSPAAAAEAGGSSDNDSSSEPDSKPEPDSSSKPDSESARESSP